MKASKIVFALIITSVMVATLNRFVAKAEAARQWSPDARVPGYLDDTFTPFLLADQHGVVHAFASQWVENIYRKRAIVYRQWTLTGGWSRPIDIILAPMGDAQILGAFLDSLDTIHIIFMAGEAGESAVYYSFAQAADADLATAWSLPVMTGSALSLSSAAIVGDDQDNLFIIYSGNKTGNGVYFIASPDSGESWSEPAPIYLTYDSSLAPYSLRLVIGPNRQIRAAWNVVTSFGVDEMLFFANYNIPNSKWDTPVELDSRIKLMDHFGPSFPVMVDDGHNIVIMYNFGNPFSGRTVGLGRPIQVVRSSSDGGQTWSSPLAPFPFHIGRSGEHALVLDGSGVSHSLFVQRIEKTTEEVKYSPVGGIWHSTFKNGHWSNPDRLVPTYAPHDVRAVVSQGNVLLAVWREDPGEGEHGVWFSYTILDAAALPVVPLSRVPVPTGAQQDPTLVPIQNTPLPLSSNVLEDRAFSRWSSNPEFPLLVGVTPVVLIVIGTLVAYHFLVRQRK